MRTDFVQRLNDAVTALGPDAPVFPEVRDPYTNQPVEFERAVTVDVPVDCGDGPTKNPVFRGLPYARLRLNPDGSIAAVDVKPHSEVTDAERQEVLKDIRKRQRRTR